jgi:predicted amidohydrolase
MRTARLVAVQPPDRRRGSSAEEQKADNVRVAFDLLEQAAERADLICLPEMFPVTGVEKDGWSTPDLADEEDGELAARLCQFARTHDVNVIAPVLGRYGDVLRNVAWVISRKGDQVGRYFKVHLTNGERERGIAPGDDWPVFELDFGRVGVMTCHDIGFPESARCLALNGAEVVCWPHVQSGWGDVVWDITLRSRAIDNAIYVLSSSYGVPPDKAWRPGMMVGRSGLVGPDGTVVVDGGRIPGIYGTTVDLDHVLLKHNFTFVGDHDFRATMQGTRRPDTYAPLTQSGLVADRQAIPEHPRTSTSVAAQTGWAAPVEEGVSG